MISHKELSKRAINIAETTENYSEDTVASVIETLAIEYSTSVLDHFKIDLRRNVGHLREMINKTQENPMSDCSIPNCIMKAIEKVEQSVPRLPNPMCPNGHNDTVKVTFAGIEPRVIECTTCNLGLTRRMSEHDCDFYHRFSNIGKPNV